MEMRSVEVYSETSNCGIVRKPGRSCPGSVIQGDSLAILCSHARAVHDRAVQLGDSELVDEAAELLELLRGRLGHYEKVLTDHGIDLPYHKSQ